MKKKITILVIVLALVILIGGGVWQWKKSKDVKIAERAAQEKQVEEMAKQEQENQIVQVPVDTGDWKTYTDKKYGFEIKYNPNWEVRQNQGVWALGEESMVILVDKNRTDVGINIGRIKSNSNPKEWFWEKQLGSNSVIFDKEYLLNNYDAYYAKVDIPSAYLMHDYLISNKKSLILFLFQEKDRKLDRNTGKIEETGFSEYLPEFEAMVNSIRFFD